MITWIQETPVRFHDQETGNYTKKHHTKGGVSMRAVFYLIDTPQQEIVFSGAATDDTLLDQAVEDHKAANG